MATLLQLSEKIGFSVLIKLANLHEIKKYIEVAYKDKDLAYSAYFLLQFVDVNIFDIDLLEIPIFLKETEKRLQNKKNALLTSKRHVMFNLTDQPSFKSVCIKKVRNYLIKLLHLKCLCNRVHIPFVGFVIVVCIKGQLRYSKKINIVYLICIRLILVRFLSKIIFIFAKTVTKNR